MAELDNKKMWESIVKNYKNGCLLLDRCIDAALQEQGFEYKDDKILPIGECDGQNDSNNAKEKPSFKVGDRVVRNNGKTFSSGNFVERVTGVERIGNVDDIWLSCDSWTEAKNLRLWTIEDAKDGDILFYNNGMAGIVMIFKKWKEHGVSAYSYVHCTYDFDYLWIDDFCDCGGNARPATESERASLFETMKKYGYVWDAKRLKKIEKPQELSEFEKYVVEIIDTNIQVQDGLKNVANRLLLLARKQIASEINADAMLKAFKDSLPFRGELQSYGDALFYQYKMGVENTLNKIKRIG